MANTHGMIHTFEQLILNNVINLERDRCEMWKALQADVLFNFSWQAIIHSAIIHSIITLFVGTFLLTFESNCLEIYLFFLLFDASNSLILLY